MLKTVAWLHLQNSKQFSSASAEGKEVFSCLTKVQLITKAFVTTKNTSWFQHDFKQQNPSYWQQM